MMYVKINEYGNAILTSDSPFEGSVGIPVWMEVNDIFCENGFVHTREIIYITSDRNLCLADGVDSPEFYGIPEDATVLVNRQLLSGALTSSIVEYYSLELAGKYRVLEPIQIRFCSRLEMDQLIRKERDAKLSSCDWTMMTDVPISYEKKAEWATYRQTLRDLPSTQLECTVDSVVWPVPPIT